MVSYGNASGAVPPFSPLELTRRGSLFLTRPTLFHYTAKTSDLARGARELFNVVGSERVKVRIGRPMRSPMRRRRIAISRRAALRGVRY